MRITPTSGRTIMSVVMAMRGHPSGGYSAARGARVGAQR